MSHTRVYGAPRVLKPRYLQPRLLHWLDQAWDSGAPLIILRGHQGSGKSTLLATWLEYTEHDVSNTVWYYPFRKDFESIALWRNIIHQFVAAGILEPDCELVSGLVNNAIDDTLDPREWLLLQLNSLPHPLHIIIDDFAEVSADSDRNASEDFFWLAQRTRNIRCIVLTESPENQEYAHLLHELSVPVLTERELLFSRDEVEEFYASSLEANPDAVELLYNALQGGVRTTANVIRALQRLSPEQQSLNTVRELVGEQLDNQFQGLQITLNGSPELLQLQKLAVPEALSEELIEAISEVESIDATLRYAEEHGIASWHDSQSGRFFTIAPALRERLASDFEREHPAECREIRRKYIQWLLKVGKLEPAFAQIELLEDWDLLSELLMIHNNRVRVYHWEQILEILKKLPAKTLRKYPLFLIMMALSDNANQNITLDRILTLVNLGLSNLSQLGKRENPENPVIQAWIHIALAGSSLFMGRFNAIKDHLDKALKLVAQIRLHAPNTDLRDIWSEPASSAALCAMFIGDYRTVETVSHEIIAAFSPFQADTLSFGLTHSLSNIAYLQSRRGNHSELLRTLAQCERLQLPARWQYDFMSWGLSYAEARLALDALDTSLAKEHLSRMDQHFPTLALWVELYEAQVLIELLEDNAYMAAINLNAERQRRKRRHPISSHTEILLESYSSILLLAAERFEDAQSALASFEGNQSPDFLLSRSLLELVKGNNAAARAYASTVIWNEEVSLRQVAHGLLLKAVAEHREGRIQSGVGLLKRALRVITDHELRLTLMLVPQHDLRMLWKHQNQYPISLLENIPDHFSKSNQGTLLTKRELEILRELDSDLSIGAIAEKHYVSRNTIKAQLRSIYRKLEASSREAAVNEAFARGILHRSAAES